MIETLQALVATPESINQASQMHYQILTCEPSLSDLLQMIPNIESAIKAGSDSAKQVTDIKKRLTVAPAIPAKHPPIGF